MSRRGEPGRAVWSENGGRHREMWHGGDVSELPSHPEFDALPVAGFLAP